MPSCTSAIVSSGYCSRSARSCGGRRTWPRPAHMPDTWFDAPRWPRDDRRVLAAATAPLQRNRQPPKCAQPMPTMLLKARGSLGARSSESQPFDGRMRITAITSIQPLRPQAQAEPPSTASALRTTVSAESSSPSSVRALARTASTVALPGKRTRPLGQFETACAGSCGSAVKSKPRAERGPRPRVLSPARAWDLVRSRAPANRAHAHFPPLRARARPAWRAARNRRRISRCRIFEPRIDLRQSKTGLKRGGNSGGQMRPRRNPPYHRPIGAPKLAARIRCRSIGRSGALSAPCPRIAPMNW